MYLVIHDKQTFEMFTEIQMDMNIEDIKGIRMPMSMTCSFVGRPIYQYDANGKAYLVNHATDDAIKQADQLSEVSDA